jgi:hypothetical protein
MEKHFYPHNLKVLSKLHLFKSNLSRATEEETPGEGAFFTTLRKVS